MNIRTYWLLPLGHLLLLAECGKAPAASRPPATNTVAAKGPSLSTSLDERIDIRVRHLSIYARRAPRRPERSARQQALAVAPDRRRHRRPRALRTDPGAGRVWLGDHS
jgi:hypothetical protein